MSYSAQQLASSQRKHLIIRNPEMPDTPITVTPRVVPGAPPPAPVSKSQKKKRKGGAKTKEESEAGSHVAVPDTTSAALIEEAPKQSDVKEGVVAPQLVVQPSEGEAATPVGDQKPTPIVDMLNKRLKANGKKIVSVQVRWSAMRRMRMHMRVSEGIRHACWSVRVPVHRDLHSFSMS